MKTDAPLMGGENGYIYMLRLRVNLRRPAILLLLIGCVAAAARDQPPPQSASALIREVVANEITERTQQRKWIYLIDKQEETQRLSEEQVDTVDGPLYRVLAINGAPLNAEQREQDNARIDRLLQDPIQQSKIKREQDGDEQKLENLMRLMPDAFVYDYDGFEGNYLRLRFEPKASYDPPTYEARVAHNLSGIILIDSQQKRLAKFSGKLISGVEFGHGFLGHIDRGGTVEIGRAQVAPSLWKTSLISIQLSGRIVFFKTVSKHMYETRSGFRLLPNNLSLSEASQLLAH